MRYHDAVAYQPPESQEHTHDGSKLNTERKQKRSLQAQFDKFYKDLLRVMNAIEV